MIASNLPELPELAAADNLKRGKLHKELRIPS